jgi:phosphate-selective porin OprO/OprP
MRHTIKILSLLFFFTATVYAQQDPLDLNDTAVVSDATVPAAAPPMLQKKWNQFSNKYFTLNLGFAILLDHNIVNQDDANVTQVGSIGPGTEFRGDRFLAMGNLLFFKRPWRYMVAANFNGLDAPEGKKRFDFIDWNLEIPFGAKGGWITLGKQKEGIGHEYIAPGTQLQFMERSTGTPMFIRQRNIGIRYSNSILGNRATYTIGFFNNYWETGKSFSDNGSQVVVRASGLPHYKSDRELIHLAVGYRHTGSSSGQLSYKAKPEVNTAPLFINTGTFAADRAGTLVLEGIGVKGPVTVWTEYMRTAVRSADKGNPVLDYWQTGASFFLTGENRRYNKMTGNLGKLIPRKNFRFKKGSGPGAWEFAARYTNTNGTDAGLTGGTFRRFSAALSWYPNAHFRYEVNFGKGTLDRGGITGRSTIWQFRAQFEL